MNLIPALYNLNLRELPMPTFNKIAIISINFIAITLILTVLNHDKFKVRKSQIFILMGLAMLVWVNFAYLARVFGNIPDLSLFCLKIAWTATPFVFFFTYMTSTLLAEKEKPNKIITIALLIITIVDGLLTEFTTLTITGSKFTNGILDIVYGKAFYPYLISVIIIIFFTLAPLVKTKFETKTKLFLTGVIIFYIMNFIFNITLPVFFHITNLYFLGDYSTVFLLGFTMYAIFTQNLFDINVFATEIFTLIIWTVLFTKIFFSGSLTETGIDSFVFVLTIVFGILLIRSVRNEIKQREELRETKERELAKARELLRLKDEFVFIATHDLKTPVAAIDGFVSLISQSREKFSPKTKDSFQAIIEASDRLKQLVNDLLEVARSEAGTIKVEVKPVNIVDLIKRVMKEIEPKAKEEKITITSRFDKSQIVLGDEAKILEVLENLTSNSLKYNKKEGRIDIVTIREGDKLLTKVGNTGPSIPKEEQGKIFQKFFRVVQPGTENITGTGLGLFVTRMLIEKMHGTISFVSEEGKGTTFTFELPLGNV